MTEARAGRSRDDRGVHRTGYRQEDVMTDQKPPVLFIHGLWLLDSS